MSARIRGLNAVLGEYLAEIGSLTPVKLGEPRKPVPAPSPEQAQMLYTKLVMQSGLNSKIIIVNITLHCLILLIALGLAIRLCRSATAMTVLGGSSLASLLAVTKNLQQVWREKVGSDMLSTILPNLAPSEAVKAIQAMYYQRKSESTKGKSN